MARATVDTTLLSSNVLEVKVFGKVGWQRAGHPNNPLYLGYINVKHTVYLLENMPTLNLVIGINQYKGFVLF